MQKNILIVSGHPDLKQSLANKTILDELKKQLQHADFALLDQLYPNFQIDVETEQQRLINANIIVLQFPFFWYSIPALMKKWMEDVFVHGFSHGSTGNKLHDKKIILSFTSGAPEEMYQHGGPQNYTIDDFMPPLKQFANLCGMKWEGFIYTGGVSYQNHQDPKALEDMKEKAVAHAAKLIALINKI